MRRVFVDFEAMVTLPVRVRGQAVFLTDDDAHLEIVLKQWAGAKRITKADPPEVLTLEIVEIGDGYKDTDELGSAVEGVLNGSIEDRPFALTKSNIVDSK